MKTAKLLMLMFVILFAYGFTINHFVADNGNSPFPESLNKRVSNSNLYRYLAFSNWMEKIESKKTTSDDNAIDQDWYSTVIENIKKEEYNITYIEKVFSYQSPNRANNYRFKYFKDGFSVSPMLTKIPLFDESDMTIKEKNKKYKNIKDWKITMRLHSFGKNGNLKT
ncbi:hypothetical protein ACFLSV_06100, partial [Bacteroidota bacterium]